MNSDIHMSHLHLHTVNTGVLRCRVTPTQNT